MTVLADYAEQFDKSVFACNNCTMTIKLKNAVGELNSRLAKRDLKIQLVICGAFAIELHGFNRSEETQDIDTHTNLKQEIQDLILEISKQFELNPNWLNNQVSDIQLPEGAEQRMLEYREWSQITVKYLSVEDLIKMKIGAWLNRGALTDKDFNDLVLMGATKDQIENGINYVINTHQVMNLPQKFKDESLELLNALRNHFK
jgi:hypothetical protein